MARQQLVKRTHILAYNPIFATGSAFCVTGSVPRQHPHSKMAIFRHFYSEHGRKSTTRSKEGTTRNGYLPQTAGGYLPRMVLAAACTKRLKALGLCSRCTPSLCDFDAAVMPYTYAFFALGLPTSRPNSSSCVRGL